MDYKEIIRNIPDFPKEGIIFRDITTLLLNNNALQSAIDEMADLIKDLDFDYIAGPESRGFIFGMPIAYKLNKGFIPVRKFGKLPGDTVGKTYDLEYGTATIEIHKDAIKKGDKIIVVDDLLATGGTSEAVVSLIEQMGGEVTKLLYLIELEDLKGKNLLKDYDIASLVKY